MSWRRLAVLVRQLPSTSRTVRAVAGDGAAWGEVEHLLANVIDLQQHQLYQFASANSGKGRKPKKPKPFPRPGVKRPGEKKFGSARMSTAEVRRWLDERNGRRAGKG